MSGVDDYSKNLVGTPTLRYLLGILERVEGFGLTAGVQGEIGAGGAGELYLDASARHHR